MVCDHRQAHYEADDMIYCPPCAEMEFGKEVVDAVRVRDEHLRA